MIADGMKSSSLIMAVCNGSVGMSIGMVASYVVPKFAKFCSRKQKIKCCQSIHENLSFFHVIIMIVMHTHTPTTYSAHSHA